MDDVLADFAGATESFLREHHPDIHIIPRSRFYLDKDYPEGVERDIIHNLHVSQHFFRDLPEISGATIGWQRIIDLGYEPRICSSPLLRNPWCEVEKLDWIEQHLGSHARETAIITLDKALAVGTALIDDRPVIKNADKAIWKHITFNQSYNTDIETPLRLDGWNDENLAAILERTVQMAQQV